ncbi:hypothetical protein CARUB_v10028551mg [Capsella rubella]|uniref:Uncharacterized protein n=1 Tax=Capsella rubella TaxID=81985 RepID=R0GS50_9BRAS|nr:uncharacterized protein LOC17876936 [Capsella rubella]EOA15170.1 hypothetical protein CARUB_v10028551mg [Capsella rubella]
MAILTPVIKLVVFRQSLRPHSAIAFLVEFLCFVLELLDKEKDLAKIFGIILACNTLIFTLLDIIQNLIEEEVRIGRCGRVFWLYTKDGSLYWHTLNAYQLMLCIIPLFASGLELVPQEAYRVLAPNQETQDPSTIHTQNQIPQEDVGLHQDSQDCIAPHQVQLDGIELAQGTIVLVHAEPLQDIVEDGIELEEEVVVQVGPNEKGP